MRRAAWAAIVAGFGLAARPPATGMDLLEQMRAAYAGKWYTTLTFVQRTTARHADGKDSMSTWYESVRYTEATGTQLRIDIGEPAAGNGVLYTADSLWVMRGGQLTKAAHGGNALLPLIESVYLQPVPRTVAELAPTGVDLYRKLVPGQWHGRFVWIVGVTSVADTTSPQLWVDTERNVVVRAIIPPVPGRPMMDARFDGMVPLAGGWLATKCTFYVDGKLVQTEEYSDWKANVPLAPSLFDITQWITAPHWASQRSSP